MSHITASSAQRPPFSREFYLALATTLFFALGVTILLPVIPLYITDELGAADRWIGTATLTITAFAVSLRVPGGTLSDRRGRRGIMLIGAGFGVLAGVLYLASNTLWIFLLARASTGISLGIFTSANKALSVDLAPPERRGEALGLNNAAFSLAMVVSPLIGEALRNALSFQAVFATSAMLNVLCLAVTGILPRVKPVQQSEARFMRDLRAIVRARATWAANITMLGLGATMAIIFTFYPLLAERKDLFADAPRVLSAVAMGLGFSIWALSDTLVEPLAGRLSDRFGRQAIAVPGLILAVTGLTALSHASTTLATYVAVGVMSLGWGTTRASTDALAQDAVAPALRGISAAVLYSSFDVAVGLNAQLLSSLIDGSDFTAFFRAATVVLLIFAIPGIVLATRVQPHDRVSVAPPVPLPGAD